VLPDQGDPGWLETDDEGHVAIVRRYLDEAGAFGEVSCSLRTPTAHGDPLYGVWARRAERPAEG
jgi:hypothetical protein